jgi:putative Mg2+ transporter-C (MgtC) family protein
MDMLSVPGKLFPDSFLFRLLFASLLGAVIGFERDLHGRAAGLRTNLLVSLGSAVFMLLSESVAVSYSGQSTDSLLRADPGRIAAQIITGIGFLGAGTIIKSGLSIRGLTTAACLWISAGIGMSVGAGYYLVATAVAGISLFSLIVLNRFERVYSKDSYRILEIKTSNRTDATKLIDLIKRKYLKIIYLDKEVDYEHETVNLVLTIRLHHKDITDKLSHQIIRDLEKADDTLLRVKWRHQ